MTAFYMTRLALPAAVLLAVAAAWLSLATLAVAAPDGPRIALLPLSLSALLLAAAAAAAVIAATRARVSLAPISLLALVIVPWVPLPLPAALLVWAGSIKWLVWCGAAVLLAAPLVPLARMRSPLVTSHPRAAAGACAFIVFSFSAWQVAPSIPGGDEPHYLVITQSLLRDGDLQIENNHRRGDYQAYYPGHLAPHYIQRGRNGQIYSIHAPGLPAIVAPAFAVGGYRAVVLFLIAVAACGSALAWHVAWLATKSTAAAWFGWAAVTLSATTIFHSFTVYPDGLGGVVALTGVWAILRAREERDNGSTSLLPWLLHGAALAVLPWMHSRFALLAGSIGALVLLRLPSTRQPAGKATAFLIVPSVSALAWVGFFIAIYGRADPSAPYGLSSAREFSLAFIPGGITGLFFDQRFGLIANAPVLAFAVVGLAIMLRHNASPASGDGRRLACELLFVIVPYLLTATSYAMWWAGWSAPARFANPAVFALAIPCAAAWDRFSSTRNRAALATAAGALMMTIFLSGVLVTTDGGRLAYNTREATALWLDWASRLTALGDAVPAWFRGREGLFARDIAIWIALFAAAYVLARLLANQPVLRGRSAFATAVAWLFAAASMIATTLVWHLHGTSGVQPAPAQLDFLRQLSVTPYALAVQLTPPRRLDRQTVLASLRIESPSRALAGGMGRNEAPMISLPAIPAGRYRIVPQSRAPGGWLIVGVGQDQFALRSEPLAYPAASIAIDLPVDVRSLSVRGDEDARRLVRSIAVEPVGLTPGDARLTDRLARRAARYAGVSVFFLDDSAFPEPEGLWIGGARQSQIVVQSDIPRDAIRLHLRNAPVENRVVLTSGDWHEELALAPNQERQLDVPLVPGRAAALVTISSAAGFRPTDVDASSRDVRFLGVWLGVEK
jgi:hypothetical protein